MDEQIIKKYLERIRNLKQYKDKTEQELLEIAKRKAEEELSNIDSLSVSPEEKRIAKKLLAKYMSEFSITNVSDRGDLNQLIYQELLHRRFQTILNKNFEDKKETDGKDEKPVPIKYSIEIVDAIHNIIKNISDLKNRLGLAKKDEGQDPLRVLTTLKKRFEKYVNEHRDDFTMKCMHCGEFSLLRRRTKDYISGKHPFLLHNLLYNEPLLRMVVENKITKEDAAKILSTSPDYISWVIEKHYLPNKKILEFNKCKKN